MRHIAEIKRAVADFPNVEVFDPLSVLCPETKCLASLNGHLLYEDDHHLSVHGARLVTTALNTALRM
jgi:hypothetical protein